jgi:uncharacterized RDD family membrane protein YckC
MTSAEFDPNSPQYGFPPAQPQWSHTQPGGVAVRFFARVIDGILVNVVAFGLSLVLFDWDYWWMVTGLFSGVMMFGYFVLFEVTYGASLGKRLLGLTVHGPGGAPKPDFKQSAIRNSFTLLAVVPYNIWHIPIGPLLAFIAYVVIAVTISSSPTKQGKHDELAGGTQVVKR